MSSLTETKLLSTAYSGVKGVLLESVIPRAVLLIRDLVNSFEPQTGEEEWSSAPALETWLHEHELMKGPVSLTSTDLGAAKNFREGLRALLLSHAGHAPDDDALRQMQDVIDAAAPTARLDASGLHVVGAGSTVGLLVGLVLDAVRQSQTDNTWQRLKACERSTCLWAYYDASRNHSRRWCSMEGCGNVLKMRRRAARETEN